MKKAPIIRFLISITMLINIIAYPIGATITNPAKINSLFDAINFEERFLSVFTSVVLQQLETSDELVVNELEDEVVKNLINTEALKTQREKAVEDFYKSIANREVPNITLELGNPLTNLKQSVFGAVQGVFTDGFGIKELCNQNPESFICSSLGSLLSVDFHENGSEELASENLSTYEAIEEMFTINTSLGITDQNIDPIYKAYRIAKYGPETLLVIDIVLLMIGYIITLPSRKFSRSILFAFIKLDVFALAFWWMIPLLISGLKPIRISPDILQAENDLNQIIGDLFGEIAKTAFLIPAGFTLVALAVYFVIPMFSRMSKNVQTGKQKSVDTYDSIQKEEEEKRTETKTNNLNHSKPAEPSVAPSDTTPPQ